MIPPPAFRTQISAEELAEAGWAYVGPEAAANPPVPDGAAAEAVRRWHDTEHPGPFRWCSHDLCREVGVLADAAARPGPVATMPPLLRIVEPTSTTRTGP